MKQQGKDGEQCMNQYIITEEKLVEIGRSDISAIGINAIQVEVRSHPYNPQAEWDKVLALFERIHTMLKSVCTSVEDTDHWKLLKDVAAMKAELRTIKQEDQG